jgi:glycerol-3-phosphate O-acyltransferase/dihydroxyacetone phosphate acyltransferase
MLYNILGRIIRSFLQLFYKRIYINGLENIPKDKPIFLASNHSNALMDGLVIAVFLIGYRSSYFLGRASIFGNKFLDWLFKTVQIIPIYRPRDGEDYTSKNVETFERVDNVLLQNKAILIFPEGNCVKEKRLRPLKKGTVRMAFSAWGKGADVHIIPIGISYTKYDDARSEVMLSFGKPIRVADYRSNFGQNSSETYTSVNHDLKLAIESEMVLIENADNEEVIEQMLEIGRNDFQEKGNFIMSNNPQRLYYERQIANKINRLAKEDKPQLETLKANATAYFDALKTEKTSDKALVNYEKPTSFIIQLLAPFAMVLGVILHFPLRYLKPLAMKMTRKDKTMFITLWIGLLMGFYLAFGLLWIMVGSFIVGFFNAFFMGIGIVVLTYGSGIIIEKRNEDKANSCLKKLAITSPEKIAALKKIRLALK